jgi:hypothetical protein
LKNNGDFFGETNSEHCVTFILSQFFAQLSEEEKTYGHLMLDSAMFHSANISVNMFAGFFGKRVTIRGLWPAKPLTRGNVL